MLKLAYICHSPLLRRAMLLGIGRSAPIDTADICLLDRMAASSLTSEQRRSSVCYLEVGRDICAPFSYEEIELARWRQGLRAMMKRDILASLEGVVGEMVNRQIKEQLALLAPAKDTTKEIKTEPRPANKPSKIEVKVEVKRRPPSKEATNTSSQNRGKK